MNESQLHEAVSTLFVEVRALPEEARLLRLEQIQATDPRIHHELTTLLAFDEGIEARGQAPSHDRVPQHIGPYRVIRRVGQGGSGVVFLAEQAEPVQRRVALKLMPHAAVDPSSAARFEFERHALERTDHPGIARILDAGRTNDGVPYIVMDFIDGTPIHRFARERGLDHAACVALIISVAEAVQHAHQRGVIHRDLKPANILVMERDGRAVPVVVDFGIARPLDGASGMPDLTQGLPLGTPMYMAPEQTGLGDADTRTDVYAIGAVLYELIAGTPPIEMGPDGFENLRRVRQFRPAGATRLSPIPTTNHAFAGDLDRVIARCLEKSPDRRYATAADLAADLGRLLRREPVTAAPSTAGYRLARFTERHRGPVIAASLALAAIILGMAGLSIGLLEAGRQRARAVREAETLAEVNRFLTDDILAAAAPDENPMDARAVDLVRQAASRIEPRLSDRPLVAASVHHTVGTVYSALGTVDEAQPHLERAVELRRLHAGPDAVETVHSEIALASLAVRRQDMAAGIEALTRVAERARYLLGPNDPALYTALNDLGTARFSLGEGPAAIALLNEALAGRERLLGDQHPDVLVTMSNLAQAYDSVGDSEGSLSTLRRALEIAQANPEPSPMLLLGLNNNIGATLQDRGRHDQAAPYLREAARLAAEWLGPESPDTLIIRSNLAGLEARTGRPDEAERIYREVAEILARTLGPDASDTLTARYGACNAALLAGRPADAVRGFESLLPDVDRILGPTHWVSLQTRLSLAAALNETGDKERSLTLAVTAAEGLKQTLGPEHTRTLSAKALADKIRSGTE
jgi:eukaryotic-like serine/threonine-protein kinase